MRSPGQKINGRIRASDHHRENEPDDWNPIFAEK